MKALTLWPQPLMPFGYERRLLLDPTTPCWPWPGVLREHGYGEVMIDGHRKYSHRLAYQLHIGPIPRGWELDHVCHTLAVLNGLCAGGMCRHRSCWNPEHLEAVSSRENSLRGRHPLFAVSLRGECRRGHDLTVEQNVYVRPDGRRRCRVCQIDGQRDRRAARRASSKL